MRPFQIALAIALSLLAGHSYSQTWTVYNTTNSSLLTNHVTAVGADYGWLYVATENGGVAKMVNNNWANIADSVVALSCSIRDIAIRDQEVWLATDNNCGLMKLTVADEVLLDTLIFNLSLSTVDIDNSGTVWIGNFGNGGLYEYAGFSNVFYSYNENNSENPNDYVHGIGIVNDSTRWVVGTHEVGLMADSGWTVYPNTFTPYPLWWDVEADGDSAAWFAANLGLVHYDGTNWIYYDETNSGMPASTGIEDFPDVAIDYDGNKWLASGSGLVKFDGTDWTVYTTSNSDLPSNIVTVVEVDSINNVWVGTENGLVKITPSAPSSIVETEILGYAVYPNPTTGILKIHGLNGFPIERLTILDLSGKVIRDFPLKNNIDISDLSSGLYLLEVQSKLGIQTSQVVKK